MTLLEKMDRAVYATGIPRILFMQLKPRALRWTPLLVMAILAAGYVLMAKNETSPNRLFFIGCALFYGAFAVTSFLRFFGPRLTGTARSPLDERELMVKARAHSLSGTALATFAMLGCFYMTAAGLPGFWFPRALDWMNLGFALQAGGMLLPTLIASWLQPRPVDDED
jgi:ABC-type Fe3+-siderophore transport system permease subunit